MDELTPRQIVEKLDEHIIGQKNAKKAVAIALRNRSRRKKLESEMREEVYPKNIIMIGATGVGKTEIARRISKLCGAPFLKVEATKYTEVGYVGRDVESMIRDLATVSLNLVKTEYRKIFEDKSKTQAEEKILDILLPPHPRSQPQNEPIPAEILSSSFNPLGGEANHSKPIGFDDATHKTSSEDDDRYQQSRELMRKKLRQGKLDDQEIEIDLPQNASMGMPMLQVFGAGNLDGLDGQLQNILGDLMPKKQKKRKMKIQDALKSLSEAEADKLIDQDKIQNEAIHRVEEMGIIFLDEIDKIASRENRSGADVSREGVQRDLLPIVEGATVQTKIGAIKTDHILFIAAGAFHMSKPSDLIPELQGRFPIRVELDKLSEDDFFQILSHTKSSLVRQYQALLATEGVDLQFEESGIREVARMAYEMNEKNENIGARRLNTILERLLEEVSFSAPDLPEEEKKVLVHKDFVSSRLQGIIENKDLNQYIL